MSDDSKKIGKIMVWLTWLIVLYFLFLLFSKVLDHQKNPNQNIDSITTENGVVEIVLEANRGGQYVANGFINKQPVTFLVDTGASDVAIPIKIAERLQLTLGNQVRYHTANGTTIGYQTHLDEVRLGDITIENVRGGITPNMQGNFVLLGMSFLKKLEFTQRGKTLTVRQYRGNL